MKKVRRQKVIEGTSTPGIIKNGNYFYTRVDVYADGMCNCWELTDLKGIREKMAKTWLNAKMPVGESISIHELGSYTLEEATWTHDTESYLEHLHALVRTLNPDWTNIYQISEREKTQNEKRQVSYTGSGIPFYVKKEQFYDTKKGDDIHVFMEYKGHNYLVNLTIFEDGKVSIYQLPEPLEIDWDTLMNYVAQGKFFSAIEGSKAVIIKDLGVFSLSCNYSIDVADIFKSLEDLYRGLQGQETLFERCRNAYHSYLEYPSDFARNELKKLYESLPEHERMYLGDMDIRNGDYERILYSDSKREV